MPRVLPAIEQLVGHAPERTVFSRFIPPASAEEATGMWKIYYQKWECVTRQRLAPELLDLVTELGKYAPPALSSIEWGIPRSAAVVCRSIFTATPWTLC